MSVISQFLKRIKKESLKKVREDTGEFFGHIPKLKFLSSGILKCQL